MIKNYLIIAYRNLQKYKFISFINLFGLTVGLTCCLLILTYIFNELSYDRYNKNADNIYRISTSFKNEDGAVSLKLSTAAPPVGYYLPVDFPEIQKITRLRDNGITPLQYKEKLFNEHRVFFADENLFDVFSIKIIKGNPQTALTNPFSIMLTEESAKKYFGTEDPMNKLIRYNNQQDMKVTGIYKAFPANAHLHPGMLISFSTLKDSSIYGERKLETNWGNNVFLTYLQMPPGFDKKSMEARLPAFLDKRFPVMNSSRSASKFITLGLQKLTDIHLFSHTDNEAEPAGEMSRIYVFSAIALFILLIACINYMNLATARSILRAKEIGIRKVVGAGKKELIFQFTSESILLTCAAILIATVLVHPLIEWMNNTFELTLSADSLKNGDILIPLCLSPFVIGTIAGFYPAVYMSSFQPVKTLKGLFKATRGISLRKVLVVTQFAISIVLIITTMIVFQQLHFMQKKSLGFDREQIVTIPYNSTLHDKYEPLRTELLSNSNFKNITRTSAIPTNRLLDDLRAYTFSGDSAIATTTAVKFVSVDYDFIPTYGLQLAAGRNFSREYGTDTAGFVLNEAAVTALGWKADNAVGRDFRYGDNKGRIIGVVKDFHFESLHQSIVPIVFVMFPPAQPYFNVLSIKFSGSNTSAAMAHLESSWKKFLPGAPFGYAFLDENFETLYDEEQKQQTIFTGFACIAILIACLGLFGLSTFIISQRVKEIGIRKVLGASIATIVKLLSKDFLVLVSIGALIAFPLAWYAMDSWLRDFAYRINIQWWVFVLAGVIALLIAFFTVSLQSIRAATDNPVKSLRAD